MREGCHTACVLGCSLLLHSSEWSRWGRGGLKEEERKAVGLGSLAVPGAGPRFWVLLSLHHLLSTSFCLPAYLAGSLVGFNNSV